VNRGDYFILTPTSDQGYAVARILLKHSPSLELIGLAAPGEHLPPRVRGIVRLASYSEVEHGALQGRLIPTGAQSTRLLLERGAVELGEVTMAQSSLKFFDKKWANTRAAELDIHVPRTFETASDAAFPLFYKEAQEVGGGVRGIAQSFRDLPPASRSGLLYQELIRGRGTYGVGFLAQEGRLLATHIHFESESFPAQGGSAVLLQQVHVARLVEYTQRLVGTLFYSGWGLAEYKYCPKRDDYVFMELNAKLWASCEMAFINEPRFVKKLFGINIGTGGTMPRAIFLERAFARGPGSVLRCGLRALAGDKVIVYPDAVRRILRLIQAVH
jgi:hypothetical protein